MPVILDLFCGAGGSAEGYSRAGFEVVGVDIAPQPRYPFAFLCGDALRFLRDHGHRYDAIHASPPCQAHSAMRTMHNAKEHRDLIGETRSLLEGLGKPYVIENVPGAPLVNPVLLCGTMFNLGAEGAELRRHRLFETNVPLPQMACEHTDAPVIGVYGGHVRNRRRRPGSHARGVADFTNEDGKAAMDIDWMTLMEMSQAIPPAYTQWVGYKLLESMR